MTHTAVPNEKSCFMGFLNGISPDDLPEILDQGSVTKLKTGSLLFSQGEPALRCHLVLRGRLKLSRLHEQGREFIARYIDPGQMTAAVAMFKDKTYPVSAHTIGETEVICWDRKTMVDLMHRHPGLAVNMLRESLDRLEDIQTRYIELVTEPVDQRIARALLRMVGHGNPAMEKTLALSRQDLADFTGTTVYTVSRTLSHWVRKGWIKPGREKITLVDPGRLAVISEGNRFQPLSGMDREPDRAM